MARIRMCKTLVLSSEKTYDYFRSPLSEGDGVREEVTTGRRLIEMLAVLLCKAPLTMSPTTWAELLRNQGKTMAGDYLRLRRLWPLGQSGSLNSPSPPITHVAPNGRELEFSLTRLGARSAISEPAVACKGLPQFDAL